MAELEHVVKTFSLLEAAEKEQSLSHPLVYLLKTI